MSDDHSEEIAKLRSSNSALLAVGQKHYGQLLAIEAALLTLIETHSDPARLLQRLSVNLEPIEAMLLGGSQSEMGLESFQVVRTRLADICQIAIARKALDE